MPKNTFDFGFAIKQIRETKKISVRELAILAKISPSTISSIENNNRSISVKTAVKIAEALGIEIENLFKIAREFTHIKATLDEENKRLKARILPLLLKQP